MELQTVGRYLLWFGIAMAILGGLVMLGGRLGLGSLPGDIRIQTRQGSCFIPIVSSIVLSLLLTLLLNIIIRLFR